MPFAFCLLPYFTSAYLPVLKSSLLLQLESCELHVLSEILGFLHDYQDLQRQLGCMCPSLGHIFGHALLRPYAGPLPMAFPEDVAAAASLLDCMITDYTVVFSHPQHAANVHKPPSRSGFCTLTSVIFR